jgi:hypothetical protein
VGGAFVRYVKSFTYRQVAVIVPCMGIAEDIAALEQKLEELIRAYDQYFQGIEPREPLRLLEEVERTARSYVGTTIVNTMVKFRYNSLVARLNSYKQHWNRILRQIDEGKLPRDRVRMKLHEKGKPLVPPTIQAKEATGEMDVLLQRYLDARKSCNLAVDTASMSKMKDTLERQRSALQQKHSCKDVEFRVVIEDGKPKIKARPKG